MLASACPNQWFATGAPGKLLKMDIAPALPRTADVALQERAAHWARMTMVTPLVSVAPHLFAAA
jgi:hypothetical protein